MYRNTKTTTNFTTEDKLNDFLATFFCKTTFIKKTVLNVPLFPVSEQQVQMVRLRGGELLHLHNQGEERSKQQPQVCLTGSLFLKNMFKEYN